MPAVKRIVEPIFVSRGPIPKGVPNELEAVAVNTLSGVIRQLSSLAKHAEDIFGEIFQEAMGIHSRCSVAQDRIDRLSVKVTQLDSAGEEISLQDINMQKAFKMNIHSDQQVVARKTLPASMKDTYERADPVPDLNRLNKFRSDDKPALQFYTHPGYFFELWLEKMSKEFESRKKKKKKANRGKREDKKTVSKVKQKEKKPNVPDWEISSAGSKQKYNVELVASNNLNDSPQDEQRPARADSGTTSMQERYSKRMSGGSVVGRPPSAPPPPPPPGGADISRSRTPSLSPPPPPPPPSALMGGPGGDVDFPPPPPTMTGVISPVPPPPPPPMMMNGDIGQDFGLPPPPPSLQGGAMPPPPPAPPGPGVPAPPPPPPPPAAGVLPPPPPPSGGISAAALSQHSLRTPAPPPPPVAEPTVEDDRNDLLAAIRKGMALKKVQERKLAEKKEDKSQPMDVASILARRIAMEISDSEDEGDDDSDDDGWSDDG